MFLLTLGTCASVYMLYKKNLEQQEMERQKDLVKKIVYHDVGHSCRLLTGPIVTYLTDYTNIFPEFTTPNFSSLYTFLDTSKKAFLAITEMDFSKKVNSDVNGFEYENFYKACAIEIPRAKKLLEEMALKYQQYLDGDDIAAIDSLVRNDYINTLTDLESNPNFKDPQNMFVNFDLGPSLKDFLRNTRRLSDKCAAFIQ